jgi:hypothetical protein
MVVDMAKVLGDMEIGEVGDFSSRDLEPKAPML